MLVLFYTAMPYPYYPLSENEPAIVCHISIPQTRKMRFIFLPKFKAITWPIFSAITSNYFCILYTGLFAHWSKNVSCTCLLLGFCSFYYSCLGFPHHSFPPVLQRYVRIIWENVSENSKNSSQSLPESLLITSRISKFLSLKHLVSFGSQSYTVTFRPNFPENKHFCLASF